MSNGGGTLPNLTHSKQNHNPGDVQGAFSFYRLAFDGAGTSLGSGSYHQKEQLIENGTRYLCGAGKKVTVSFWGRSNVAGKRIGVYLRQNYGSGGTPSVTETISGTTFTLTSIWQKFTYTFTTNTLAGKTFGSNNDDYLAVCIMDMWGSGNQTVVGASSAETFVAAGNLDTSEVQVNAGDQALPFQPRSYDDEEKLCLRYNRRLVSSASYAAFGVGYAISTTQAKVFIPYSIRTRIIGGTLTTGGNLALQRQGPNLVPVTTVSIDTGTQSRDGLMLTVSVASGLVAGEAVSLLTYNDTSAFLNFDFEL
ncbi:hypothetical protein [Gordoniibacillus kamchatkensis]|uniref:hypothetical protein n=1 Tax=Gordoniibacillus kamchatkensis TaxID=1590651 RepID=UPI0012E07EC8|nr:hypothetical protein [Paenibacillus sp. VKM B-2647]